MKKYGIIPYIVVYIVALYGHKFVESINPVYDGTPILQRPRDRIDQYIPAPAEGYRSDTSVQEPCLISLNIKNKNQTDRIDYRRNDAKKTDTFIAKQPYIFYQITRNNEILWKAQNDQFFPRVVVKETPTGESFFRIYYNNEATESDIEYDPPPQTAPRADPRTIHQSVPTSGPPSGPETLAKEGVIPVITVDLGYKRSNQYLIYESDASKTREMYTTNKPFLIKKVVQDNEVLWQSRNGMYAYRVLFKQDHEGPRLKVFFPEEQDQLTQQQAQKLPEQFPQQVPQQFSNSSINKSHSNFLNRYSNSTLSKSHSNFLNRYSNSSLNKPQSNFPSMGHNSAPKRHQGQLPKPKLKVILIWISALYQDRMLTLQLKLNRKEKFNVQGGHITGFNNVQRNILGLNVARNQELTHKPRFNTQDIPEFKLTLNPNLDQNPGLCPNLNRNPGCVLKTDESHYEISITHPRQNHYLSEHPAHIRGPMMSHLIPPELHSSTSRSLNLKVIVTRRPDGNAELSPDVNIEPSLVTTIEKNTDMYQERNRDTRRTHHIPLESDGPEESHKELQEPEFRPVSPAYVDPVVLSGKKIPISLDIEFKFCTYLFDYHRHNNLGTYTTKENFIFAKIRRNDKFYCMGSDVTIWQTNDIKVHSTKVNVISDNRVVIHLNSGKTLFYKRGFDSMWFRVDKSSYDPIDWNHMLLELDIGSRRSTQYYEFFSYSKYISRRKGTYLFVARERFRFKMVYNNRTVIWRAYSEDECAYKVGVYRAIGGTEHVTVFLVNGNTRNFMRQLYGLGMGSNWYEDFVIPGYGGPTARETSHVPGPPGRTGINLNLPTFTGQIMDKLSKWYNNVDFSKLYNRNPFSTNTQEDFNKMAQFHATDSGNVKKPAEETESSYKNRTFAFDDDDDEDGPQAEYVDFNANNNKFFRN
nr:hypothetical protein MACL_00001758 [Theileria orientalis]